MTNPDRQHRLAAKLRENLKRRKAQAKVRAARPAEDDTRGDEVLRGKEDDGQSETKPRGSTPR